MAENYITLKKVLREEFATKNLCDIAKAVNEKIDSFVEVIEQQKNPHAKHLVKMIESTLRAKQGSDLSLDLDAERSQLAAWFEEELKPSSDQNVVCDKALVELTRFFKSESHKEKGKILFEIFICEELHKLVSRYKENILEPFKFHEFKSDWLMRFNQKMPRVSYSKKSILTK